MVLALGTQLYSYAHANPGSFLFFLLVESIIWCNKTSVEVGFWSRYGVRRVRSNVQACIPKTRPLWQWGARLGTWAQPHRWRLHHFCSRTNLNIGLRPPWLFRPAVVTGTASAKLSSLSIWKLVCIKSWGPPKREDTSAYILFFCGRVCLHRVRCFHQRSCLRCDTGLHHWHMDWPDVKPCVIFLQRSPLRHNANNCVGESWRARCVETLRRTDLYFGDVWARLQIQEFRLSAQIQNTCRFLVRSPEKVPRSVPRSSRGSRGSVWAFSSQSYQLGSRPPQNCCQNLILPDTSQTA